MTTYGTIPTSSDNGLQHHHIVRSGFLSSHRPWREMAVPISPPRSISTALSRIKANVSYFYTNYAIVVLCSVFLSLLWRPVSLIAFTSMMIAWLYLYFLRDEPLVIAGYAVDERAVLIVLSIFTTALLLATATVNVVVALAVGAVVVLTHGVFSGWPEMDAELSGTGGPGLPSKVHLVETASSTFSTS